MPANPTMPSLLSESSPGNPHVQWVLIVLAAVTILYVAVIRPAFKKKNDPLARSPAMGSLSQQRSVERQMQNLLVELSEMARQISAQLDTRSQKLQLLIEDADQRIALMQKLEQHSPIAAPPPADKTAWSATPLAARSSEPLIQFAPKADPENPQHQPVYLLADQGRSALEISRELDRPRGEVELILALRPSGT